jgi:hypothetical protein
MAKSGSQKTGSSKSSKKSAAKSGHAKTSPKVEERAEPAEKSAESGSKAGKAAQPSAANSQSPSAGNAAPPHAKPAPPPPQESPALPATSGKVSIFGGPRDRGIKPDDKLALPTGQHFVYERVRSLNPSSFYCSMRWQYQVLHMTPEEVKRWWANKKLQITNRANGVSVVARAVDWGPHENTGLDVGVSPGAASALGVEVGDEVEVAMADPRSPLGVVG